MNDLGKAVFLFGLVVCAVGLLIWSGLGRGWLGHLPGDIHYTRGNLAGY